MTERNISWDEILLTCSIVADKIIKKKLKFDAMIIIPRGGLVPGRIIAEYLDIHDVRMSNELGLGTFKEKVLIVDEIADTGKTLTRIVEKYKEFNLAQIATAVLFKRYSCHFEPDFQGEVIHDNSWLNFPWEFPRRPMKE